MSNERKIILDTETTGLSYLGGDRVIEIAAIEFFDDSKTGESFHAYVNPERNVSDESFRIHGLSGEFLKDKPLFNDIKDNLISFIGDSKIIAHNSDFDRGFINVELERTGIKSLEKDRFIDSLVLAKEVFPGQKISLDALCEKLFIDKSARKDFHGALIDVKLLAEVYAKLVLLSKDKQSNLLETINNINNQIYADANNKNPKNKNFKYRKFSASSEEIELHHQFLEKMKKPVW